MRNVSAILAVALVACGRTEGTEQLLTCNPSVSVEVGAVVDCPPALAYVTRAERATGIDLSQVQIVFEAEDDLAELGHPEFIGFTGDGKVHVAAKYSGTLVHEAYHVGYGQPDHCGWSSPARLMVFEENLVWGSFDDACAHVRCSNTTDFTDARGQVWGLGWKCD